MTDCGHELARVCDDCTPEHKQSFHPNGTKNEHSN